MNIENKVEREYNKQTGKTRYNELLEPCEDYMNWLEEQVNNNVFLGSVSNSEIAKQTAKNIWDNIKSKKNR